MEIEDIKLNADNKALKSYCESLLKDLDNKYENSSNKEESDKVYYIREGVQMIYDYINRI